MRCFVCLLIHRQQGPIASAVIRRSTLPAYVDPNIMGLWLSDNALALEVVKVVRLRSIKVALVPCLKAFFSPVQTVHGLTKMKEIFDPSSRRCEANRG